jgi:hypothetical protein
MYVPDAVWRILQEKSVVKGEDWEKFTNQSAKARNVG